MKLNQSQQEHEQEKEKQDEAEEEVKEIEAACCFGKQFKPTAMSEFTVKLLIAASASDMSQLTRKQH